MLITLSDSAHRMCLTGEQDSAPGIKVRPIIIPSFVVTKNVWLRV